MSDCEQPRPPQLPGTHPTPPSCPSCAGRGGRPAPQPGGDGAAAWVVLGSGPAGSCRSPACGIPSWLAVLLLLGVVAARVAALVPARPAGLGGSVSGCRGLRRDDLGRRHPLGAGPACRDSGSNLQAALDLGKAAHPTGRRGRQQRGRAGGARPRRHHPREPGVLPDRHPRPPRHPAAVHDRALRGILRGLVDRGTTGDILGAGHRRRIRGARLRAARRPDRRAALGAARGAGHDLVLPAPARQPLDVLRAARRDGPPRGTGRARAGRTLGTRHGRGPGPHRGPGRRRADRRRGAAARRHAPRGLPPRPRGRCRASPAAASCVAARRVGGGDGRGCPRPDLADLERVPQEHRRLAAAAGGARRCPGRAERAPRRGGAAPLAPGGRPAVAAPRRRRAGAAGRRLPRHAAAVADRPAVGRRPRVRVVRRPPAPSGAARRRRPDLRRADRGLDVVVGRPRSPGPRPARRGAVRVPRPRGLGRGQRAAELVRAAHRRRRLDGPHALPPRNHARPPLGRPSARHRPAHGRPAGHRAHRGRHALVGAPDAGLRPGRHDHCDGAGAHGPHGHGHLAAPGRAGWRAGSSPPWRTCAVRSGPGRSR